MEKTKVTDAVLVKDYINGNELALSELIRRHQHRIYSFIYSKVFDKDIAEDIFQDTFIKVINTLKRGKYNEEGKFLPWVMRIAHNLVIDHFRKNNLRRKVFKYLKDQNITCIIATHDITDALAFADTTMVLKDHNIYAKATPEDLYNNPPNKYVASLFGDVNELMLKDIVQNETSTKKIILYPEELKVSRKSPVKATVIDSYFKGNNYLIEADLNGKTVFAEHRSAIPSGAHVYFVISKPLIEKRKI